LLDHFYIRPLPDCSMAFAPELRQVAALRRNAPGPNGAMSYTPPPLATDDQIETLVATFYARIRKDPELGPIFQQAIGEDWTAHLKTMCDFWSSVMNTSGRYQGKPIPAHLKLPGVEPRHFEQWLRLFSETARELFGSPLAGMFVERAERIAESLKLGFAFHTNRPDVWGGLPRSSKRPPGSPSGTDAPCR
jgi:hemoglobin